VTLLYFVAMLVAVVSVIMEPRPRYFDKITWVLFVLFLPIIGIVAWFMVGRDRTQPAVSAGYYDSERVDAADDVVEAEFERD
jgi:hypothetical protein